MIKNVDLQQAICYSDIIVTTEKFLQKAKKPQPFKTVINHILKVHKINPKMSLCYGNIHYAISADRRFVSRTIKSQTKWALRDWFSGKDLRVIQNKNVVKTNDEEGGEEDPNLLVGNNAIDIEEDSDEEVSNIVKKEAKIEIKKQTRKIQNLKI